MIRNHTTRAPRRRAGPAVIACLWVTLSTWAQAGAARAQESTPAAGDILPPTAAAGAAGVPAHALAMHGRPKYGPDFTHFDYADPDAPKGGAIRLHDTGSFDSINPYILQGTGVRRAVIENRFYETLIIQSNDEPFTVYGCLAETIETDEARTYVAYKLHDSAKWSDGTPLTVDDVIFSFELLKEKADPFWKEYFKDIAAATKTEDGRVRFDFTPGIVNRELPLITGQFPVFQQAWWKDRAFDEPTLDIPVSSGPYTIGAIDAGRSITFKRNPDWWGEDLAINAGRYNFDEIRYDYYRDSTVAHEAFKAGEYDFRSESSAKNWATGYEFPAIKEGKATKEELPFGGANGMYGIIFNLRRPMFQDRNVRLALMYAFDFEWANANLMYNAYVRTESYFANSELAATGLPKGEELTILEKYRGRVPDEVFTQAYKAPSTGGTEEGLRENLKTATELLEKAGYSVKDNVLVNSAGEPLKFEMVLLSPTWERMANPYIESLKKLGIEATSSTPDETVFTERREQFDYDAIVYSWGQSHSPGNEQRSEWTCESAKTSGSYNYIGLCDPVVDELTDLVVSATDRESLIQRTRALDRVLLWGHYVIPAWHNRVYRVGYWNVLGRPEKSADIYMDFDTWYFNAEGAEEVRAAQEAIAFVEPTEEGAAAPADATGESTAAATGEATPSAEAGDAGAAGPEGGGGMSGGMMAVVIGLVVFLGMCVLVWRSRQGGGA